MEQLIYKSFDLLEGIGIANAIVLLCVLAFLFLSLVYMFVVLESYSSLGSIRDIVSFGSYQVVIKDDSDTTKEIMIITAWNKVNAVERTARKLDTINEVTFVAIKL